MEKVDFEEKDQEHKHSVRRRKDGRTRVIFENGTESNMFYRSLYKALLANGRAVTENTEAMPAIFEEPPSTFIREDDKPSGFIYILESKSQKPEISSIPHLYKIGYSTIPVKDRIKNARKEPTYLMDDVKIVASYQLYNLNAQKLEQLLHTFFGAVCVNIDIIDLQGARHIPREWFTAPLPIIEEAILLIISGEIIHFKYDSLHSQIVRRNP